MDGGKMDVNSKSAFENFPGQHNLENNEEGAEDNSIEDDMEVILDQSENIFWLDLYIWLQQENIEIY